MVVLCATMEGQESGAGERLKRSVGDGESKLAVADEEVLPSEELTLHIEVTLHAEPVVQGDELVEEDIDAQGDAQEKRLMSHFGSPDLVR